MQAKPLSYVGGTMVMQENDETGYTLSIDYTFRSRLRNRLTLSRLTWLRKPWAFGERVFHPL